MVRNRIKERLSDAGISAKALSERMPDGLNPVAMTFIMAGKVLPTREGLQAMCSVLNCKVSDLYDLNDLNLLTESCPHTNGDDVPAGRRDAKEEFRSWMLPEEKSALRTAISSLGYRSMSEWLREMTRQTLERCLGMKLSPQDSVIDRVLQDGIKQSEVILAESEAEENGGVFRD